jgi:GT2 family glycosyltransferase
MKGRLSRLHKAGAALCAACRRLQTYARIGRRVDHAISWEVRGFGERQAALVRLRNRESVVEAIAVCEAEAAMIRAEIAKLGISRPRHVAVRPTFEIRSRVVPEVGPADTNRFAATTQYRLEKVAGGGAGAGFNRAHGSLVEALVDGVSATAASGSIVLVGEARETSAAAARLRDRGFTSIVLQPGYGTESKKENCSALQRPAPDSFFEFLLRRGTESPPIGAIVFVENDLCAVDLAAACDVQAQAPMWLVQPRRGEISRICLPPDPDKSGWPKISIVMPSFNQASYLEEAIRSVLDQNYPFLEFILVDGGSTDGSIEIISRYRAQCSAVIVESDKGQSDALNKGFSLATGEVMNWLCSDDLLEPGALERVAIAYRRHEADLIAGGCVRIGGTRAQILHRHHNSLKLGVTGSLDALDILKFTRSWEAANYFFQPEVFFSRRIWDLSGAMIKRHLYYAMDYDLWLRMALAGATFRHLPVMIGSSRVHTAQKTQNDRVYLYQIEQMMAEYQHFFESLC